MTILLLALMSRSASLHWKRLVGAQSRSNSTGTSKSETDKICKEENFGVLGFKEKIVFRDSKRPRIKRHNVELCDLLAGYFRVLIRQLADLALGIEGCTIDYYI
jgi:hypothetical protein